jgi:hypothetical protein
MINGKRRKVFDKRISMKLVSQCAIMREAYKARIDPVGLFNG